MIGFPAPKPGQVIRYAYLWRTQADAGQEEGLKTRPSVVVLVTQFQDNHCRVIVAPITHSPPHDPLDAIALTGLTCARLGLDASPQWIMASEVNAFIWPGPDLRPLPGRGGASVLMGYLPANTFLRLTARISELGQQRRLRPVPRTGDE